MATATTVMQPTDTQKKAQAALNARHKKSIYKKWKYYIWIGGSVGSIIAAVVLMIINPEKGAGQVPVNDPGLITHANRNAKTWSAGASTFFEDWTIEDVKNLEGTGVSQRSGSLQQCTVSTNSDVPEKFDAREKWKECFNAPVYSMGNCSAGWAITAASTLSNRYCISDPEAHSELVLSPQELLSCDVMNRGCTGGDIDSTWEYIQTQGLVSETCMSYQGDSSVSCGSKCTEEKPFKSASRCILNNETTIKREIMTNGPVIAPLFLTNDFLVYKGGIYQESATSIQIADSKRNRLLHPVKIIGWGSSRGNKYWLVENSWGQDWGEGGFAKILMGTGNKDKKPTSIVVDTFVIAPTPQSDKLGAEDETSNFEDPDDLEDLDLDDEPAAASSEEAAPKKDDDLPDTDDL